MYEDTVSKSAFGEHKVQWNHREAVTSLVAEFLKSLEKFGDLRLNVPRVHVQNVFVWWWYNIKCHNHQKIK